MLPRLYSLVILAVLILLTTGTIATAQQASQPLRLKAGIDAEDVAGHIRYGYLDNNAVDTNTIALELDKLRPLSTESIHFGPPKDPILVAFDLHNDSSEPGAWILTTGRGALLSIRILSFQSTHDPNTVMVLFDSQEPGAVRDNLRQYQAFSSEIYLRAGERRTVAILFESENSTYLPLKIQTYGTFFKDRRSNVALVAGVTIGALVLIFLNVSFFSFTGLKEFIWLGGAEFFFLLNTLHAEGYTGIFLFPTSPDISLAFGDIVKCGFSIFMAQFARSFLKTNENFLKLDIVLKIIIFAGSFVIVMESGFWFWADSVRMILFYAAWITAAACTLILPIVGVIATKKLGRQYWPLILAWGSLGAYVVYAAVASAGIIPNLPINWHLAAPIGLFEGLMATLALGLHIRNIQSDKIRVTQELTQSLEARLEISEHAQNLSEQRAAAIATIADQSSLLHASGHDSRQVISALHSAVAHIDAGNPSESDKQLSSLLQSSVEYLEDIAATTMSTPLASVNDSDFVVLSAFPLSKLFRPLEMIYAALCRQKSLKLTLDYTANDYLITDRALLMRALSNLVANAVQHTDHGEINLSASLCEGDWEIILTDTGRGIAPDLSARLNTGKHPRLKSDEAMKGTGSGFYAARRIVLNLGGTITIANAPAGGTTVTINLPYGTYSVTPCTLNTLRSKTPHFAWFDADKSDARSSIKTTKTRIAVSYDDRVEKREQIGKKARLMFLKPLVLEMGQHKLLSCD